MRKTRMNWGKVFRFMAKTAMAFAFAVVILAMTNALEASAANTGKVTASAAKVRESASTSSEAIASVTNIVQRYKRHYQPLFVSISPYLSHTQANA